MKLLTVGRIFGSTKCHMYTIEWQKCGLSYVHILLWLEEKIKSECIDHVISAELPDPDQDPVLFVIIKTTMIHGPCGSFNVRSPCMVDSKCSKRYPKVILKETETGEDSYPQYRRLSPADGEISIKLNGVEIDNRWVVPYNPVLLRTFKAHINVECCNSVKSINYLCKYITKGSDQAAFTVEDLDEVSQYEAGRYISSSEAVWRIFRFPIHERFPPVMHFAVHLENGQRIYFTEHNVIDKIDNPLKTTLMAFFELCQCENFAKTLLYVDVPAYYTWQNHKFLRRKQGKDIPDYNGVQKDHTLGRRYTVHPINAECYYLRLLLREVRGPTTFSCLKTVDGVLYPTFQAACRALGLLEDDADWDHTLEVACVSDSPKKIRELFSVMLVFCQVSDSLKSWEKYRDNFSENIRRDFEHKRGNTELTSNIINNQGLSLIEDIVISMSGKTLSVFGLQSPSREEQFIIANHQFLKELSYDENYLCNIVAENVPKLNQEQKEVYEEILNAIDSNSGQLYILDAPGGTGKTFLINLLLARIRSFKNIALAVASSGIASTLIDGGRTAHSTFELPLNLCYSESPLCNISKQSDMAHVVRKAAIIIWDECTMAHKKGIEALDRTLKDIRDCDRLMG
ncbi:uncharacterized protein LOC141532418 [Cotesia typhae]|uniref:uncharacterized protein LOC141532418 n=1 Tax=Cotesia typhae TaxID=2053667 RepID=UPI003D6867E4